MFKEIWPKQVICLFVIIVSFASQSLVQLQLDGEKCIFPPDGGFPENFVIQKVILHFSNERSISKLTIFIFLFCIFASLQFWSRNNLSGNPLFALSDGVSVSSILSARSLTTADNVQPFKRIICTFLCCHPDNFQKSVFSKYMNILRHFGDTNIGKIKLLLQDGDHFHQSAQLWLEMNSFVNPIYPGLFWYIRYQGGHIVPPP